MSKKPTPYQQEMLMKFIAETLDETTLKSLCSNAGITLSEINWMQRRQSISFEIFEWVDLKGHWHIFLQQILQYGELSDFCRLISLCESGSGPAPGGPDPVADILIQGWQAFINRDGLRQMVRLMAEDIGPRILVISGPPKSGKSYCT